MKLVSRTAFAAGAMTWSLAEYCIHRFIGHGPKRKKNESLWQALRPSGLAAEFNREHVAHHVQSHYFAPTERKVLAAAAGYFGWAGPVYGLFGLGLSLYFSSLGAGKAVGPVLAGTLRLVMVAGGGLLLAMAQSPTWTIFALLAAAMAVYGIASVLFVHFTPWGTERA